MTPCDHILGDLNQDGMMTVCLRCRRWFEAFLRWEPDHRWWFKAWRELIPESAEQVEALNTSPPHISQEAIKADAAFEQHLREHGCAEQTGFAYCDEARGLFEAIPAYYRGVLT
jgi:hypothetical protein